MWNCIGKVTVNTAGVPTQVTTTHSRHQSIFFQQMEANTGKIYICSRATADKAGSGDNGILAIIPAPTVAGSYATVLPYAQVSVPNAPGALDPFNFWLDVDVSGDSCQVSAVRP